MFSEIPIHKVVCPKGHDAVVRNGYGAFRCLTCNCDYSADEVQYVPIDQSGLAPDPYYKSHVYGKPN